MTKFELDALKRQALADLKIQSALYKHYKSTRNDKENFDDALASLVMSNNILHIYIGEWDKWWEENFS